VGWWLVWVWQIACLKVLLVSRVFADCYGTHEVHAFWECGLTINANSVEKPYNSTMAECTGRFHVFFI
jgi:hypothetical protein